MERKRPDSLRCTTVNNALHRAKYDLYQPTHGRRVLKMEPGLTALNIIPFAHGNIAIFEDLVRRSNLRTQPKNLIVASRASVGIIFPKNKKQKN